MNYVLYQPDIKYWRRGYKRNGGQHWIQTISEFDVREDSETVYARSYIVQYSDIMRFMALHKRNHKVFPNLNSQKNSNSFARLKERDTL